MSVLLGIDIGTSSTKAMLFDTDLGRIGTAAQDYNVEIPREGYAEQPADYWWDALLSILARLKKNHPAEYASVAAVGFSGQMHGLVTLDRAGNPLRPTIIWLDQRSDNQISEIYEKIGIDTVRDTLHNRFFTGFGFPSLLWIKECEPENYKKIGCVMNAKDYIRYRMTGNIGVEASDASSTTGFDIGKRDWAWDMIDAFDIPRDIFPKCHEATDIAGYITSGCAEITGLKAGIPVVYGSGDVAAHILGTGICKEGLMVSNIGTGGQLSVYSDTDIFDRKMRIHNFCNGINRSYVLFGGHLCSGMSLKWLKNQVLALDDFGEMDRMASEIEPGSDGLIYLPYLTGSRSPEMDPLAKGMFFGLQLGHDRRHFIRSVMEGVIFDFKTTQVIFEEIGIKSEKVIACGGGAKSPLWLQMQADILNRGVQVCTEKEQACLGACIMAGVGSGILPCVEDACRRFVTMEEKVYHPIPENVEKYSAAYEIYKQLYSRNKDLFYNK